MSKREIFNYFLKRTRSFAGYIYYNNTATTLHTREIKKIKQTAEEETTCRLSTGVASHFKRAMIIILNSKRLLIRTYCLERKTFKEKNMSRISWLWHFLLPAIVRTDNITVNYQVYITSVSKSTGSSSSQSCHSRIILGEL